MHVAQLRKEFDDLLFTRASSGLAFTPGGLRLASRAVEILGLQDRTVREVSQAGHGRRVLRLACTEPLRRARRTRPDRPVRGACRRPRGGAQRATGRAAAEPVLARSADVAVGPAGRPATIVAADLVPALRGGGRRAARPPPRRPPGGRRRGPAADLGPGPGGGGHDRGDADRAAPTRRSPRSTSASSRARRPRSRRPSGSDGVTLAVRFAIVRTTGRPATVDLDGPGLRAQGLLGGDGAAGAQPDPGAAELMRFITTPRATQAMVRGAGVRPGPVQAGHARHALELSPPADRGEHVGQRPERVGGQERVAVRQRRRHRADQRLEARQPRPAG